MAQSLLSAARKKEVALALERGLAWLLKHQLADGAWHSVTYGGLRDGAAVTSLALYTLAQLPQAAQPNITTVVENAGTFLQEGFQKRRTIASPDGSLDYPTYAAAMVVTAAHRFPTLAKLLPRARLIEYLLGAQVSEPRGFTKDSPDYGGWDLLGVDDARGITTGTNVSVTLYAVEALANEDSEAAKAARVLAKQWLLKAQNATGDGSFPFTADAASLNNKALWRDDERRQPRGYGSPTADGIQALLHCGLVRDDQAIESALKWLIDHPEVEIVPGFQDLPVELGWRDGLRYYYAHSLARVLRLLPVIVAEERADKLAKWLLAAQSAAGAWKNESARMREDDPLIATSFALAALATL